MICKNCKGEVDKKAVVCVHCGCKLKKPLYKKWWLWIIALIVVAAFSSGGKNNDSVEVNSGSGNDILVEQNEKSEDNIEYETADLAAMIDELKSNAMKAENKYKGKRIEITAKIASFDSDGKYITIEAVDADEWNLDTAMCYIKNEEQRNILIEKNIGDIITIKGKIKSIGEVLGYSLDIEKVE